jgi:hypothetical protein
MFRFPVAERERYVTVRQRKSQSEKLHLAHPSAHAAVSREGEEKRHISNKHRKMKNA